MTLRVLEALGDPPHDLWITPSEGLCRRLNVRTLSQQERYAALATPHILKGARVTPDQQAVLFPGGLALPAQALTHAPEATPHVDLVALVPAGQRYRPLYAFLYQVSDPPAPYPTHVNHVEVIRRYFSLTNEQVSRLLPSYPAPEEQVLARLADLALFLDTLFGPALSLSRAPWWYAEQQYPNRPLLHTIVGCLQRGRPDLIERPCLAVAQGLPLPEEA